MPQRFWSPESDDHLNLDALRFLSTVAIVAFHYRTVIVWSPVLEPLHQALDLLPIAVDLFFVMSGVIMADLYGAGRLNSWAAYGTFLRRRFARLGPLHYATLLFFIVAVAIAGVMGFTPSDPAAFDSRCIAPNVLFLQAFSMCPQLTFNKPSWSISAEMVMYLALPGILWLASLRRLAWALVVAFLAWAVVSHVQGHVGWPALTWRYSFIRAFPSFLLGVLLAQNTPLLMRVPKPSLLLGLAGVGFLLECVLQAAPPLLMITIWLIATFGLAADRQGSTAKAVRAIAPLGRLTYSVYMLHHPVAWLGVSYLAIRVLHLTGAALNLAIAAITLIVLPAVSIASLALFETPLRKALSGRSRRPEPEAVAAAAP